MNRRNLGTLLFSALAYFNPLTAGIGDEHPNDTIRTYNIDEIVVTSSLKETNNIRSLPGSISLLTPQAISSRQIYSLKDISTFVPNLYIPDYGSRQTSAIYIRGTGARSSGQSIGLYVDNAPYLNKSTFDFELMDIQRIEILRGPQGTLYGRNAMGGIINIYTLSPLDYQGTKLGFSAGSYGSYKAKASHYAKIGNSFGISASAYYDHTDGFFTNQYDDKKIDSGDAAGGKIKLEWQTSPLFKATYSATFDYTDQGAFAYGLYNKDKDQIMPVNINDRNTYDRKVFSNNLSLEYTTGRIILSSTTGYQYLKDNMWMDQDFSEASIFTLNQRQKQKAVSEEVTIRSNTASNYQWSFGAYGFYNDLKTEGPVKFKEDGISSVLQPVFDDIYKNTSMPFPMVIQDKEIDIPGSFDTPTHGIALYHQSTINNLFTKGLSLTAGIRMDYEKQKMHYESSGEMNLVVAMPGGREIPLSGESLLDEKLRQEFWQVLPKISLKYQCTPRTFTYFTVAKGYKTGGYNVQMSADVMQNQLRYDMMKDFASTVAESYQPEPLKDVISYKPEQSWNYELGMKSELVPHHLESELVLFYTDIRDVQITQFAESGNGRILANAGKARSLGLEASLRARITNEWTADFNYGFTLATFRNYIQQPEVIDPETNQVVTAEVNYNGNRIPYIPQHTLNAGLQYNKIFRNQWIDQFSASAQVSGTGKIYWTEVNDIRQKFYATLNAKVGVRKGIVKIDLWSRNITNTEFAAFYFESFGNPFIQKGKPFQIGAELSIVF